MIPPTPLTGVVKRQHDETPPDDKRKTKDHRANFAPHNTGKKMQGKGRGGGALGGENDENQGKGIFGKGKQKGRIPQRPSGAGLPSGSSLPVSGSKNVVLTCEMCDKNSNEVPWANHSKAADGRSYPTGGGCFSCYECKETSCSSETS